MKVIKNGIVYMIQPSSVGLLNDGLPASTFFVRESDELGFYLEEASPFKPITEKVYGGREEIVDRLFKSYALSERSIGVILSGDKGIGKSLFARMSALRGYENNLPLIVIDRAYRGIAQFLQKIEQECIMLFDEFEKVFAKQQETVLGLFDGVSPQKRMYIITANDVRYLNEFLINRPGRFHYHLRFNYPSYSEIREYMSDSLSFGREYIDQIASLGFIQPLNYDTLRAISFELNQSYTLSDSLSVLNILAQNRDIRLKVQIQTASGEKLSGTLNAFYNHDGYFTVNYGQLGISGLLFADFDYATLDTKGTPSDEGVFTLDTLSIFNETEFEIASEEVWLSKGQTPETYALASRVYDEIKNHQFIATAEILPEKPMHIKV